jgi:hypothetical protein
MIGKNTLPVAASNGMRQFSADIGRAMHKFQGRDDNVTLPRRAPSVRCRSKRLFNRWFC